MILKHWQNLPQFIDHVGYRFRLLLNREGHNFYIGYYLTELRTKKMYKKTAFLNGCWVEKKANRILDSVGSNYLFKVLIFDESDKELNNALSLLQNHLTDYRLLQVKLDIPITEYEEVNNFLM
jgi:hypothetical protein